MSILPVLYSFRRCPYAIRARLAIKVSNIQVELREVVLADKPAELLACSAKGTVPVLQLTNGTVIDESLDIMFWALEQNDPQNWLERNECSDVHPLTKYNDADFKTHLDHYKYAERFPEHTMETYRQQGEEFLQRLEEQLNNTQYLASDKISIVDMAIFPFIRQFAYVDKHWFDQTNYKKLHIWLEGFLVSKLFNDVMGKHLQWRLNNPALIF